jgi:queuosine precursor transporter
VTTTTSTPVEPRYAPSSSAIYGVVMALFVGFLLISNVAATKAIALFDGLPVIDTLPTDGGAILFPLTYVLGDVLAEVYGFRRTRIAIWVGFALAALASLTFWAVSNLPPAPGYPNNEAFTAILGFFPQIVLASLLGYLGGQFTNALVLGWMKQRGEGGLWRRLLGSTLVGELVDTTIFGVVAFSGFFTTKYLIIFIIAGYLWKVGVEAVCLPITYRVIAIIKRREGLI